MKTRTFYLLNFFASCLLAVALYFNFVHKEEKLILSVSAPQKQVAQHDATTVENNEPRRQEGNHSSASKD